MLGIDEGTRNVVGVDLTAFIVEILEDLFADDVLLQIDVSERGLSQDFGKETRSAMHRLRWHSDRKHAVVDLGGRVEIPAEAFEREVDLVRTPEARGAPVEHVLEEVREAVLL